jgi:hypothetical protein
MTGKTVMNGDMKLRPFACKATLKDSMLEGMLQFFPLDQQCYRGADKSLA